MDNLEHIPRAGLGILLKARKDYCGSKTANMSVPVFEIPDTAVAIIQMKKRG